MRKASAATLLMALLLGMAPAQTAPQQKNQKEDVPEDVLRITTSLVQTDVVVTDKSEKIIPDLKMEDFELYDNGKKQDLKFMEFVSMESGRRAEGRAPSAPVVVETETPTGLTSTEVKRINAFVVDDLTIPQKDIPAVRSLLTNYVDNQMKEGDLVAIVRVVGGKGLLQQLTTDKNILHRAIEAIKPVKHPFGVSDEPDFQPVRNPAPIAPDPTDSDNTGIVPPTEDPGDQPEISSPNDEINRLFRGLASLTTAMFVIDGLKEVPGHKNLMLISGGIPLFDAKDSTDSNLTNVTYLLQKVSDRAVRAGVVINTLDPRGLNASSGVLGFQQTATRPNYEANIAGRATGFGRGGLADQANLPPMLQGAGEHLGLNTVSKRTGGVSVVNTNDFASGMQKILARSEGYYVLAYTPGEKFDRKFHKIEIKVKRAGAKVFHHAGYEAREEKPRELLTKEQQIVAAASSPLSRRDIDVTPNVSIKLLPRPEKKAIVDIDLRIDAKKIAFNEVAGKHQASLDIVGFVFDQLGKQIKGFSETVNLDLSEEHFKVAMNEGLTYSASTDLEPGYYQIRSVVREASTGSMGTFSKYLEIPDLTKDRLAMSSLFLYAVDSGKPPLPLLAVRQVKRGQDLRYAAMVYNAKLKDGKPQVTSQLLISQAGKILLREPVQPVTAPADASAPIAKIGQFGTAKVPKGKYSLTLILTDTLADKKYQTLSRSLDFQVVD
jgi:VWFA-related protein